MCSVDKVSKWARMGVFAIDITISVRHGNHVSDSTRKSNDLLLCCKHYVEFDYILACSLVLREYAHTVTAEICKGR